MLLDLFLDSNILINHFCEADKYLCSSQLIDKVENGDYIAWVSDFVYSEALGELKNRLEKRKGLKVSKGEVISKTELERMIETIETFKKTRHLNSTSVSLNQTMIYDRVKTLCIQAKDAPIVMCVEELEQKLKKNVYLVTADMDTLFFKAKRLVKTLHPSFHMEKCTSLCPSYFSCDWKNHFTNFEKKNHYLI